METKKPSNPNAFPTMEHGYDRTGSATVSTYEGMTLRDYFAAKAMNGMLAKMIYAPSDIINYAELAYLIADAMLKQREL
jgi:hypothetical protein